MKDDSLNIHSFLRIFDNTSMTIDFSFLILLLCYLGSAFIQFQLLFYT